MSEPRSTRRPLAGIPETEDDLGVEDRLYLGQRAFAQRLYALARRRHGPERSVQLARVAVLRAAGYTLAEAATILGCSVSTVHDRDLAMWSLIAEVDGELPLPRAIPDEAKVAA